MNREIITLGLVLLVRIATAGFVENFGDKVFSDGIPEGWSEAKEHTTSASTDFADPEIIDGGKVLKVNFYSAKNGIKILYCTTPVTDVTCDNINATVPIFRKENQKGSKIDAIQVVVSTNNFTSFIDVGDPIDLQEIGLKTGRWVTNNVCAYIEGLSNPGQKVLIGYKFIAAGQSSKYGYVGGLAAEFVASATPTDVKFKVKNDVGGYDTLEQLNPGEGKAVISVAVNALPEGGVSSTNVFATITRDGVPTTQPLSRIGATEYVSSIFDPPLDAGENFSVSIHTTYTTYELPTLGTQDVNKVAHEHAEDVLKGTVAKRGSVWINEVVLDDDGLTIEFAGTTNRVMTSGWRIVLSNEQESVEFPVNGKLDFRGNLINGVVGLDVRRFGAVSVPDGTYVLELLNSRGISECTVEVVKAGGGLSYGMVGIATWNETYGYGYDWEGTGIPGRVFDWGASAKPTIGEQNEGQGFRVPFSTSIIVTAVTSAGTPLPYATVTVSATNVANDVRSSIESTFAAPTSEEGIAVIPFDGFSCVTDQVPVTISVSAFGWAADKISCMANLKDATLKDIGLSRVPAVDDCDELRDYWSPSGNYKWTEATDGSRKVLSLNLYSAPIGTNSTLQCVNALSADGKKYAAISFDFRNTKVNGANYNEFCIVMGTNSTFSGTVVEAVALSNKRGEPRKDKEWYNYKAIVELPGKFRESDIYLRIICRTRGGRSGAYVYLDNLRIAFQDVALPTELERSIEVPENGQDVNFTLNVLPQTTGTVERVSADLHVEKNGVAEIVPLAFADGGLTNDLSAADGAVQAKTTLGPYLVGDTVTYYAAVHFDSDDADDDPMDVRYFPDNSYINDARAWIVEGEYGVNTNLNAYTFTVDGPALSIVGDPETTTDGVRFTVHGYSANLLSEVSIYVNGEKCAEQPFDYLGTNNQIRVTDEFVIETGLNASTTYTVTIKGKDGAGAELQETTFTFLTKPKMPDISGVPKKGAYSPTRAFDFYALAEADDVTNLNFHWLLDETATKTGNGETNYTDTVEADGPHTVRVYVTDQESNVSPTNSLSWVVDTHVPTNLAIRGWPADGAVTNVTAYKLFAEAKDATSLTFIWTLNADRVEVVTNDFSGDVAAGFSTNTVSVVAKDAAGNTSTTGLTWIVDTVAPTNLTFKGRPANGTVTKDPTYRLMATALDDMERTYHWLLEDGAEVTTAEDAYLDREVDGDGKHAVRYYATDKAGNSSVTNTLSWTVDRKAPTGVKILGAPVGDPAVTNKPTLGLSAVADKDLTTITYHWLTNGVAAVTATNFEVTVTRDGAFTVSCYATDEAQNVSETNSVSWVLDTVAPTVPILTDVLENGVVTSNKAYTFSATATDLTRIDFTWVLSGGETPPPQGIATRGGAVSAAQTGGYYGNVKADGVYTITVFAKDAAGNGPVSTNWTWTVDTTPPRIVGMDATPDEGDVVATNGFDFTVFMTDATELTYRWVLNGVTNDTCTTSNYVDTAAIEGTNTVSVFAEDAAHNVCEPTNLTWVVDLHAPTNVTIHGWPMGKGTVITNGTNFVFTATAEDDTALRFFWSLNGGEVMEKAVFTSADARVREETNTVSVYAKDEAGNVSEANSWSWIVDTTPPVIKALIGKPENGALTNDQMFDFKVLATDKTAITYYWTTNDFAVTDNFTSNLVGRAIEGTNTVSVYVEDAAHNFSVTTNTVRWTLDTFHPTVKLSTGTGEEDIINATEDFFVTATFSEPVTNFTTKSVSVDNGSVVSIATNAEANVYVVKIVPKDDGPISVQIAENAVTDLAGNGNEPSTNDHGEQAPLTRTCDITLPGVSLSSSTPTYFNRKVGYMTVTVTFTEPVGGFTKNSLTIVTGQESWEVVSNEANKVFTLRVWPDNYSDEKYIGQEKITVNVLAGVVTDAAGNPNTAAAADLTKTYDTLTPTVDITSENVPDPERYFNEDKKPLLVTIVVSGSNVTELASSSVVVTNGTFTFAHTEAQEKQDIYKLEVTPLSNGVVTVLVPAGVVTNASQNVNEQPEPLVRIYDSEAPTGLRIVGSPETNKVVATTYFKFDALARDNLMQPQELEYHWILNGESRDGTSSHYEGDVPKGTNWVSVYATDAAGNSCEPVRRTWVVDYLNPTNLVLTGTPALEDRIVVTTETNFNFVATAEDETRISYLWTTNGADVADNLTTNLTGIAIEGTNVVTVTAMDEASNRWEYGEKVLTRTWVVDTLAPSNLAFVACTPKAGAVVATNGFSFTASAQDATHLTYHWILNGVTNQTCTSANFVGTTALEGTNTVSVYAEDEAHNISAATNLTWVVDMTDPEQLELSGAPEQGDVIAATNFEFHAEAKDDTKLKFRWTLNTKVVDITTADFVDALAVEGTNTVTVYAEDEAGNTCAPTSRWWVVDTIAPSNLHFVATLPAAGDVMNGAAFAFTVQAEDATQLKYHWLTNGTEVADHYDPSFGGTAVEGTNTVSVYAEDEAHNVSLTNHISWIYDFKAPSTPEIVEGAPRSGATNITAFAFTAQSKDDWSRITYHWSLTDGKTATGQTFKSDVDGDDGIYTMSVWAEDEAHNVSETNSWSWTLDRIEPVMPTITGTPASNSYVNVALFNLYAKLEKDDATAVSFHWTLDEDKTETVASNFTKSVTTEGPHTAYVYARDAAGNVSETNSWSWTYDNTPPKLLPIVGTPSNGSVTNAVDYGLQGQADEVNPVKFYWTLDGVTMDTTDRDAWFKGEVPEDYSNHVVTCYAEDAAGNVSVETNVLCWTVDTLAPTNLVISGMPANLATTNGVAYRLTATAEDDMKRTYHWALDGDAKTADLDEGVAFEGDVASGYGTHVVTCYATDVAGNVSETNSWSWTVDTKLPVLQDLSGLPEDGALTNDPSFDFLVSAEDDTALTYHWTHLTTNGYESVDNQTTNYFGTVTNSLGAVIEGLHVVSVYAEDRAHNVSETNSISWTVDVTPPTVTLESSTSSLFNKSQSPMIVEVTFSEPVTNFTAALLTVTNGNVAAMEVITNNPVSYTVAVTPARDGEVPVMVKANIATDLAGNGNVASDTLTRNCDITLPTVTLDCPLFDRLVGFDDVTEDGLYAVTVTFSEPVTNFVKSSLTVNNCEVDSVTGEGADYTVMIRPSDGTNTIQIAADAVVDRAGNGNVASLERKCVYDSTPPTQPVISGTPGCGETTTSKSFNLTVETWDANGVDYYVWVVDGDEIVTDVPSLSGVVGKGLHTVSVYVFDKVLNMSDESEEYGWTVEDASGANIEFGGGVYLEVNPETHSTNSVEFTAVDFKPGADSTVTMHGFGVDPLPANAEAPNVFELKMRLVVSDSLGGERWHVTVKETAHFDTEAKDLTVTIPEAEMKHGTPAEPYDRLFIFGVDNKER